MTHLVLALLSLLAPAAHARDLAVELVTGITGQRVFFASELGEWARSPFPMRESTPGVYSVAFPEPWLPELEYKFIVDGLWVLDPSNPRRVSDGKGGLNSIVTIEGFREDPLLTLSDGVRPFEETEIAVPDREGARRRVTVLHAPGGARLRPSVTVYFQDGSDYLERTGVASLLANLSAMAGMPELVGAFIPPKDRMREYGMDDAYAAFVAHSVVPAVERRWNTGGAPERRLLIGPSMGGLITLYTALRHRDVFGLAASQSGSLWWAEGRILSLLENDDGRGLRLFLEVGLFERRSMVESNRRAYQLARDAGLRVLYRENPATHDWVAWRNGLSGILKYFFGEHWLAVIGSR